MRTGDLKAASDFFQLIEHCDERMRSDILANTTSLVVESGEIVYHQGAPSDCVYIIASGVLEATLFSPDGTQSRALDYMTRGKVFGELGVLADKHRSARVSVRETTELIRFEKNDFLRLLSQYPTFSCFVTLNLAKRLFDATIYGLNQTYGAELYGQLRSFDLLTVFQAITAAAHSGELRLSDYNNEVIGSFFFEKGHVRFARFAHLEGIEAVWQGFLQSATEGTFAFEIMQAPRLPFNPEHVISIQGTDLLMQGATKRDDLQSLPDDLKSMDARLAFHTQDDLTWTNSELVDLLPVATQLWELGAKRPQPLNTLWRRMNYSTLTFLQAVQECITSRQAELKSESAFKQTTSLPHS